MQQKWQLWVRNGEGPCSFHSPHLRKVPPSPATDVSWQWLLLRRPPWFGRMEHQGRSSFGIFNSHAVLLENQEASGPWHPIWTPPSQLAAWRWHPGHVCSKPGSSEQPEGRACRSAGAWDSQANPGMPVAVFLGIPAVTEQQPSKPNKMQWQTAAMTCQDSSGNPFKGRGRFSFLAAKMIQLVITFRGIDLVSHSGTRGKG